MSLLKLKNVIVVVGMGLFVSGAFAGEMKGSSMNDKGNHSMHQQEEKMKNKHTGKKKKKSCGCEAKMQNKKMEKENASKMQQ